MLQASLDNHMNTSGNNPNIINYNNVWYVQTGPKIVQATTTAGKASIYATDDGTNTGNPMFVNGVYNANGKANDSTIITASSWAAVGLLITVTITKNVATGLVIPALGITVVGTDTVSNVPDGTAVTLTLFGLGNVVTF